MGLRINPQTGKLDVIEQKVPDDAGTPPSSKLDGYLSVGIEDGNGVIWFFAGDGTRYKIIGTPDSGTNPGQTEGSPMGLLLGLTYNETIAGSTQEGGVGFFGATSNLTTDAGNFFFDRTNKFLGIKTNTPQTEIDIGGTTRATKFEIDDANTHLDTDGSTNLVFTDAVTGSKTLAELAVGTDVFRQAFTNADLTAGILTVTHSLSQQFVLVQVYDNNNILIMPDEITATSSTVSTIDLSGFGTLSGTWNVVVIG